MVSPTIPPIACHQAILIGDISVPSGTQLLIGSTFTKIWQVMNTGSCTWTTEYAITYTGGGFSVAVPMIRMPSTVPTGGIVNLEVTLQAPNYPGDFQGFWMLREPTGGLFGIGPGSAAPLELNIRTFQPTFSAGAIYDFALNTCSATWVSGAGLLTCPGSSSDTSGSVELVQTPIFETQQRSGYGLLTRPNNGTNGTITGQFPPYTVSSGDVFLAEIGCLGISPGCNLTFRLDFQTSNGQSGSLGTWSEAYDGATTPLEIDLSSLAGRSIWLNFQVTNHGRWQTANAFWHQPRIQSGAPVNASVLNWSRTGVPGNNSCQELRIRMNGFDKAIAEAYSCENGERHLGLRGLSADELDQIQSWRNRLDKVNAEVYYAPQPDPIVIWIDFQGLGTSTASDADIRSISNFAASIFNSIAQ